jgi:serine/threonine protein kinase
MSSPHDTPPPELAGLNPQDLLRAGLESAEPAPADPDVTVRISPSQMAGSVPSAQQELPLPEELTALLPGGAYQVEGFLGQGGMGAVYKGTQIRLRRPVAIKIMRRDLGRDYDFEARFEREAQAMAKLNHPNIVSVIDFGEAGPDYLYIVMELVDGADLMNVIRGGQMTQEMALSLLPQICDALQFAHDHGIIHRDIKPSNIMLTRDGRIKMADFGLAKRFDAESTLHTKTGTGMGTPDYAAPEQFDPGAHIDHRADIYALGVMIYQMITGTLPRGAWKSPSERAPVAPQWDGIVTRAMQSDPADRYQHASEVKTQHPARGDRPSDTRCRQHRQQAQPCAADQTHTFHPPLDRRGSSCDGSGRLLLPRPGKAGSSRDSMEDN